METGGDGDGDGDASTRASGDGARVGTGALSGSTNCPGPTVSCLPSSIVVLQRVERMVQAQELGGRRCSMIGGASRPEIMPVEDTIGGDIVRRQQSVGGGIWWDIATTMVLW